MYQTVYRLVQWDMEFDRFLGIECSLFFSFHSALSCFDSLLDRITVPTEVVRDILNPCLAICLLE